MDFLGIGPQELIFIILIALIVFGPTDMVKAGRTLGRLLRRLMKSDLWREITRLRHLPNRLIREAGLEEDMQEINKGLDNIRHPPKIFDEIGAEIDKAKDEFSDWTTTPSPESPAPEGESEPEPQSETEIKSEKDSPPSEFSEWISPSTSSDEETSS